MKSFEARISLSMQIANPNLFDKYRILLYLVKVNNSTVPPIDSALQGIPFNWNYPWLPNHAFVKKIDDFYLNIKSGYAIDDDADYNGYAAGRNPITDTAVKKH